MSSFFSYPNTYYKYVRVCSCLIRIRFKKKMDETPGAAKFFHSLRLSPTMHILFDPYNNKLSINRKHPTIRSTPSLPPLSGLKILLNTLRSIERRRRSRGSERNSTDYIQLIKITVVNHFKLRREKIVRNDNFFRRLRCDLRN